MTIKFFLQSNKSPASIYIRVRDGKTTDAKAKTDFLVNPDNFSKGETKQLRMPPNAKAEEKQRIQQKNKELSNLQSSLDELKNRITNVLNQNSSFVNLDTTWLKSQINPTETKNLTAELVQFFDIYVTHKQDRLAKSTIKKIKSIKSRVEKYELENDKVYIPHIDVGFSMKFQQWGNSKGYNPNTTLKTLKVIKTVCNFASDMGVATNSKLNSITKNLKYSNTEHIHLNPLEINKIINTEIEDEKLAAAKDWLIISCFTAQRVSDFLRFTKDSIVTMEGTEFLDIRQKKTDAPIYVFLADEVKNILNERNGDFPTVFSQNTDSNSTIYNKLIKEVCRLAKIDNPITASFKNKETNLFENKVVPKYKAVSTHIGRRSFATNYYGKINTSLLLSATGHASEKQFLTYVGKTDNQLALTLAQAMRDLARANNEEPQLRVIKNVSNS